MTYIVWKNARWEDENFMISLQPNTYGKLFAHCVVKKYSPSVRRKMSLAWENLQHDIKQKGFTEIFACCEPKKTKTIKFFELFGLTRLQENLINGYVVYWKRI